MRVKGVQLFFQPAGFIQDFRFAESEIPALRVSDVCDESHVFGRLFGRYFFQIFDLRAFRPVLVQLSIFLFACLYGLGNGLFRGPSSFLGRVCYFGGFPCRFRGFLFDFRPIVCAIHEILYDPAPEMVALRTLFRTHLAPGVMRTNRRYDNKDSVHY